MGAVRIDNKHDRPPKRPTPARQVQRKPAYRLDRSAAGVKSYPVLQRYLGNSFMQLTAAGKGRLTESAAQYFRQPKSAVGYAGDEREREANRVATQVTAGPGLDTLDGISLRLSRFSIQAQGPRAAAHEMVDPAIAGSGRPLETGMREEMEQRFSTDLSAVRVHTDTRAHGLARVLQAQAFTIGHHVVFGAGHYASGTGADKRLLAHELTHVVQQTSASGSPAGLKSPLVVQRSPEEVQQESDPWSNLSLKGRQRAQALYDECWKLISDIGYAQTANVSLLRSRWIKFLSNNVLVRIGNLNEDRKIYGLTNVLTDFSDAILRNVAEFHTEWESVERRYLDEHDWLMRLGGADSTEAARYLEALYTETKGRLDRGALNYVTEEDYLGLKQALEQGKHVSVGVLRASRRRAKQILEMLDVVAQLRMDGVDAEKYLPGWSSQVQQEADALERLTERIQPTLGFDYPAEFRRLRAELLERRSATLKYHKRDKPIIVKGGEFVAGAAEAVVGPLVEAAKEAVDLAQINLHIVSFGKYEPKFISDMAKAAEQGATTGELLKGMVTGLLETPSRFLKAVEDGDWEAIGRESVNLYLLAKAIKEAPGQFSKVPGLVAKTRRGLRILRARTLRTKLNEPRLVPAVPPAPPARHLPSSQPHSRGPEIIGKRPGEPPKAMAEKPPKRPSGTAPTVVGSSGADLSVDIRSIVTGEIKVPPGRSPGGGRVTSEPKVMLHNEAPSILYELPDGTRLVTVRNGKAYYMSLGKSKSRVGDALTVKEAGSFYEFAGAQEKPPTPIPREYLDNPKFADTVENLTRIDKGWLIKGPGITETNPVSGLLEHTFRLGNGGRPFRSPAELNAWLSANGAVPIKDLFRDILKWSD